MRQFAVLLDAPTEAKSRLQVAALGDYHDERYGGDFSISREDVEQWKQNLEYLPGKRALIDLDHRADRTPRNTEAAGWITDVGWDGDTPMAEVEWTPVGKQAIADKRYLFFSPTYGPHKTEDGSIHDNTLIGGALTNRPFLSRMPAVTLASEETIQTALDELNGENDLRLLDVLTTKQRGNLDSTDFAIPEDRAYPIHDLSHARNALARVAQNGTPAEQAKVKAAVGKRYPQLKKMAADSRAAMPVEITAETLKLLDLPEDADEAKLLETLTALKQTAKDAKKAAKQLDKEPQKTLEQQAKDAGLVLLDTDDVRKLQKKAAAGAEAAKQLHQQRFDTAFELALADPKGPRVKPAEKEQLQKVYKLDADLAIEMIEARDPVVGVGTLPNGDPAIDLTRDDVEPETLVRAGVFPGSHELDSKIRAHMREHKLPESQYITILEQAQNGAIQL